jgi:ATP-dependent protease HslVU (ClpYQ) peptidase subunit
VVQAGRRVELVVRVEEAELAQHRARGRVRRVVAREEPTGVELAEGVVAHSNPRLVREPLAPEGRAKVNAELVQDVLGAVRSEPAAADVRTVLKPEDGPVLEAVLRLRGDLARKPLCNGLSRRRSVSVKEPGDRRLCPERHRKLRVLLPPHAEAEALGHHEVAVGHTLMHTDLPRGINTNVTAGGGSCAPVTHCHAACNGGDDAAVDQMADVPADASSGRHPCAGARQSTSPSTPTAPGMTARAIALAYHRRGLPMLVHLLARIASVVVCALLFAVPLYVWLERRHRPLWPAALGEPEPAGRGAYRSGETHPVRPGRAPATTRAVALLHLVAAGVCTWDGAALGSWVAATERWPSDRLMRAMTVMITVLCVLSPLFVISARRLLRRDPGLIGVGAALGSCAAAGAAAMLAAGTVRLPRETFDSLESLWLAGALDMIAIEVCALAFWVGARAAARGK